MRLFLSLVSLASLAFAYVLFWQVGGWKLALGLIVFTLGIYLEIGLRVNGLKEALLQVCRDIDHAING